jgi:hypothetical protein
MNVPKSGPTNIQRRSGLARRKEVLLPGCLKVCVIAAAADDDDVKGLKTNSFHFRTDL